MPKIVENFSLNTYNTFGIAANAAFFSVINTPENLLTCLSFQEKKQLPLLILGGGSNVLFTRNFDGLVLKNNIKGISVVNDQPDFVDIKVGAGENWHEFVMYAINNNYAGVENLSLIPGTVGAAPMQNIGAYGVEIKDVFLELEALNLKSQTIETFDNPSCQFAYRESIFKHSHRNKYFILSVTFRLRKNSSQLHVEYGAIKDTLNEMGIQKPTIKDISEAVMSIRNSKLPDPAKIGNSGSFFKNPEISAKLFEQIKALHPTIPNYPAPDGKVKIPAGWLIERAGWKGKKIGNIGVHEHQALVLVNYGGGEGFALKELSEAIQADVFEKFGVKLQAEVNII